MKKTILTLSAVAIVAGGLIGTGCKKSSNNSNSGGSSLVGGWEVRSEHSSQTINTTPPFTTTDDSTYAAGTGPYVSFRSNGTYTTKENFTSGNTLDSGSYSLISNNSKLLTTSAGSSDTDTTNIAISGNQFVTSASETYSQGGISYTSNYSITFVKR